MTPEQFAGKRQFVENGFGRIAYVSQGEGPAAVFIHGVPLNGYHWRGQLQRLSDVRTCIAIDLLGLGATEPRGGCSLSFPTQAQMILDVLNQLSVTEFDLVANDSGGAIAQLIAVEAPERIRSMVLTNCDVHDNWPPPAFMPAFALARQGRLATAMSEMLGNLGLARSDLGLGATFENPEHLTPELVRAYIGPLVATPERRALLDQYVSEMDPAQTVAIEGRLARLQAPTLVIWGTDDVFFPTAWAYWLKTKIPGATRVVEVEGSRLFLAEERPEYVSRLIREHWRAPSPVNGARSSRATSGEGDDHPHPGRAAVLGRGAAALPGLR
jgi:pimeloyl-ACP methyl ester carboxylesterase